MIPSSGVGNQPQLVALNVATQSDALSAARRPVVSLGAPYERPLQLRCGDQR